MFFFLCSPCFPHLFCCSEFLSFFLEISQLPWAFSYSAAPARCLERKNGVSSWQTLTPAKVLPLFGWMVIISQKKSQRFIEKVFLFLACARNFQTTNSCQSKTNLGPSHEPHFWPIKQNGWFHILKKKSSLWTLVFFHKICIKIRISFFVFFSALKSVCNLSVGEVKELTKHWSLDTITKTHTLGFIYFLGSRK